MTLQFSGFGQNSIMVSAKAGVCATDASLNEGKSQGQHRAVQREIALSAGADSSSPTQTETKTAVQPADAIGHISTTAPRHYSSEALYSHILDANSGHAPGPKPAHALLAEAQYLAARKTQN